MWLPMDLSHRHQDARPGHAHDVSVDTTFDFLNTLDTEDGFPVETLADAR